MQRLSIRPIVLLALFAFALPVDAGAPAATVRDDEDDKQQAAPPKLIVEPAAVELEVGGKLQLKVRIEDAAGAAVDVPVMFFSRSRRSVTIDDEGNVEALKPGEFTVIVRTRKPQGEEVAEGQASRVELSDQLTVRVPVKIARPPLERIDISTTSAGLYAGTTVTLDIVAVDSTGSPQPGATMTYWSSDDKVASFDQFGDLTIHSSGVFTARAESEGVRSEVELKALTNPVAALGVSAEQRSARTGDVVHFSIAALGADGNSVSAVPVALSLVARPSDSLGEPASGQIEQDGRFVAETPGLYTIIATCGGVAARTNIEIVARDVAGKLELVGRGKVHDMHTSDLWVWEGVDGRDYAVTGTWGAGGDTIFWDVTDPENIERIATVTVDARTVNDVKVSGDGRTCIISREGASNRKNGIVLVDVVNPREPQIISAYDENLTGGVHNVFVDVDKVYALSAGRRYDVIDIADPATPKTIGSYELDTPGHSIHDVWINDGLAYSSNWSDGVHIVDVGNGIKNGSPSNPVKVASYAYPSGWNHAAFPYKNAETGRSYVIAGDEAFPNGLNITGAPTYPRGWLHFIDFTDLDAPDEVARYQVPEAGTHNLWVEGDVCYAAFYNGGLRVIDLSGELMGDLYRQGREIAWFLPTDDEGYIPNASMVWGPQPYKGNIFFSDWNTGLWCVKLTRKGDEQKAGQ